MTVMFASKSCCFHWGNLANSSGGPRRGPASARTYKDQQQSRRPARGHLGGLGPAKLSPWAGQNNVPATIYLWARQAGAGETPAGAVAPGEENWYTCCGSGGRWFEPTQLYLSTARLWAFQSRRQGAWPSPNQSPLQTPGICDRPRASSLPVPKLAHAILGLRNGKQRIPLAGIGCRRSAQARDPTTRLRPSTIDHRKRLWVRGAQQGRQPGPSACPSTIRPSGNVSGTAREKSRRTICDFFQKTESDFAAPGRRRTFPLGRTKSVVGGNSEVSALREFFAV